MIVFFFFLICCLFLFLLFFFFFFFSSRRRHTRYWRDWSSDVCSSDLGKNAVAAAYRKAIAKYHGEAYSNYGLYGYFNATLFFKALRLAGKNLTRASLQKVLNTRFRQIGRASCRERVENSLATRRSSQE